jgi:DNA-binding MarR family transcriptional regulator
MAINSKSGNTVMKLWLLMHRVHAPLVLCEDSLFREYGLTVEQFGVLATVKGRGGSSRPVDLAFLLERSPNSISMLVDRMVKAGLVRRTRDRKDRRTVTASVTSKAEKAVEPAIPAGWEFIHKILSPLSYNDQRAFASTLETVKCECLGYLNPEVDMAEITKNSVTNRPDVYETYQRVIKNVLPSDSEAKRQVA